MQWLLVTQVLECIDHTGAYLSNVEVYGPWWEVLDKRGTSWVCHRLTNKNTQVTLNHGDNQLD